MIEEKPYALSCDRNSSPILEQFQRFIPKEKKLELLEVGAGTGQHAIFMAPYFPNLTWTLSDAEDRHPGIKLWMRDFPRRNLKGPILYKVGSVAFPQESYDIVFTANTLHIMSWSLCEQLFTDLGKHLKSGALFMVYGAFKYKGEFTTESNETFDQWLKEKDPLSGVRDFEAVDKALNKSGFQLKEDVSLPANNQFIVWEKA